MIGNVTVKAQSPLTLEERNRMMAALAGLVQIVSEGGGVVTFEYSYVHAPVLERVAIPSSILERC